MFDSLFTCLPFRRFEDDIEYMLGRRPGWYWKITWRYLAPVLVFGILVASLVNMGIKPIVYSAWHPELVSVASFLLSCEKRKPKRHGNITLSKPARVG